MRTRRLGADRQNDAVRKACTLALGGLLALGLAGCGGSGGGGSGSGLVADVGKADVEVKGDRIVATTRVRVGGVAGRKLLLQWGLVDAEQGSESQQERVVDRYVTTRKVRSHDETLRIARPPVSTPYLIHFVLYAPDGSYLDSSDTPDFGG